MSFRIGLLAVLATGLLATVAGHGTLAYFTTAVTSTNTFTAGTLHLNISDTTAGGGDTATAVNSSITFSNMKPGDTVYAPIEIDNVGTLDAVYGISYTTSTSGSQDLAEGLKLAALGTGASGTGTKTVSGANGCDGTNFATPGTIWPEAVRTLSYMTAGAGETIKAVATSADSNPADATGFQVAAGGKDILCLEVTFDDSNHVRNYYNNATNGATNTTVVFTFSGLVAAEPTVVNP